MASQLAYALAAFVATFVVYRPFITRLDRMRYIFLCLGAFIAVLLLSISVTENLSPKSYSNVTELLFNHYIGNTVEAKETVSNSTLMYTSYNDNTNILKDATLLGLLAAISISFCGLLSRWNFPILYVKPEEPALFGFLHRHVSSVAIILLGTYR